VKIFFDVDGVLIDGWHAKPEYRHPWDTTMREDLGIDVPLFRELLFGNGVSFDAPLHACVKGERDLKHLLAEILPRTGYTGPVDKMLKYWFDRDAKLNPVVFDAVKRLAARPDVSLYLATGQEHHRAAYLWNDLDLKAVFKDIFYSAKLGYLKNDPGFFEAINRHLSIAPDERPLFFDDHHDVVRVARAVGWDVQQVDTPADIVDHPRLKPLL